MTADSRFEHEWAAPVTELPSIQHPTRRELLEALGDASEVMEVVYGQLSDLDREIDGVERSIIAANELAEGFRRIEAVLSGASPDGVS